MKDYKTILFDLDGTLLDTSEGIYNGTDYMTDKPGMPRVPDDVKPTFIGPPVAQKYEQYFGLTGEALREAASTYREYYGKQGYREASPYPGILELLDELRKRDYRLVVATMKREDMAFKCLEATGLLGCFDAVFGNSDIDSLSKAELIDRGLERIGEPRSTAVLIGDTSVDAEGAAEAGIDFIQALYGFGLTTEEERKAFPSVLTVDSVPELKVLYE